MMQVVALAPILALPRQLAPTKQHPGGVDASWRIRQHALPSKVMDEDAARKQEQQVLESNAIVERALAGGAVRVCYRP
jgi:hypothetical protein